MDAKNTQLCEGNKNLVTKLSGPFLTKIISFNHWTASPIFIFLLSSLPNYEMIQCDEQVYFADCLLVFLVF